MRNQWLRLLLLRHHSQSQQHISRYFLNNNTTLPSITFRSFSTSESTPDPKISVLTNIFSKPNLSNDEINLDLASNNVNITHDFLVKALRSFNASPDEARRLFQWVSANESSKLSSKVYNHMLGILGSHGFVNEFWDMVGTMKGKGYGVSRGTFNRVVKRFENDKLSGDLKRLNGLYERGSVDRDGDWVVGLIRENVWGNDMEQEIRGLKLEFSSELICNVMEKLVGEGNKGLIFFRWVEEESGSFKHDEKTFNAMARVLGREESSEKFWRLVDEMRNAGFGLEKETYVRVLENFSKRKMIKDAVDLYEFAMSGGKKPSSQDCTFLLKKIVVSEELDLDLFSKVLRVFTESGGALTDTMLSAVLKSLTSVDRFGESVKVLKAMENAGLTPSQNQLRSIAFHLASSGKDKESNEFMNSIESLDGTSKSKTWALLIEGYCEAGDLAKASDAFDTMIEKEGSSNAGRALDSLVLLHFRKRRAIDAFKFVKKMVNEKDVPVWHTTYKLLISKLLSRGRFEEALDVMHLMKSQDYPPFLDPYIKYLSKTGSADDAIAFTSAVSVKKLPSTSVFLQLFEAYFNAGRRNEAQDFLAKCPSYIRNHADVLNLFYSRRPQKATATSAVAA